MIADYQLLNIRKCQSQEAISEFNLSPQESIMIGDKPTDIVAAENAGVKGLLVEPNQKLDIQILNQIIKTGN